MLRANQHRLVGNPALLQRRAFLTKVPEGDLAAPLTDLVAAHPGVACGSYPNVDAGDVRYKVKVVLEARDGEALRAACVALQQAVVCEEENEN